MEQKQNIKNTIMRKIKQSVSMHCTSEQYEQFLKEPLEKLGYRKSDYKHMFTKEPSKEDVKSITAFKDGDYLIYNKTYDNDDINVGKFNPKLFLALVAMTDGEDWDIGEWLYYKKYGQVGGSVEFFEVKRLDGSRSEFGLADLSYKHLYRKATVEELEKLFNKTEVKKEEMKQFKVTREDLQKIHNIACSEWKAKIEKLTEETLGKFSNEGELSEDTVRSMFEASSSEQRDVLKTIFKDYQKDNNAFVNEFDVDELSKVSKKLFGDEDALQISVGASIDIGKENLLGRAFFVDSELIVTLHRTSCDSTIIEFTKK